MASIEHTICSKAWSDLNIDFSTRRLRHCCKSSYEDFPAELTFDFFNNSTKIIQRRDALLNGIEHKDCNYCWKSKAATGTSYRDFENTWKSVKDKSDDIFFIEIMLDNLCDMSCIYCGPDSSSKIASEQKLKQQLRQPKEKDIEIFVDWLIETLSEQKSDRDATLSFLGGEITYSKNFYIFMNKLLASEKMHDKFLTISFLTNGNSNKNNTKKLIDILNRIPTNWSVNICISNEGWGEVGSIVRWGIDWSKFKSNLQDYIMHPRVQFLCLSPTPSLFTLDSMYDYFSWVFNIVKKYKKNITIAGNWIVFPTEIDVARCDYEKKEIVKKIKKLCIDNEEIFLKDQLPKALTWLDSLEDRIGTMKLDNLMLNKFLHNKSIEKNDDRILQLRKYI